jgi:hypothetical protein
MTDKRLHLQLSEDVLDAVAQERSRQDERWGEQNWPVTGVKFGQAARDNYAKKLEIVRAQNEHRATTKSLWWDGIFMEEGLEALTEENYSQKQEDELIQVAAVAVAMVECIRRNRNANRGPSESGL